MTTLKDIAETAGVGITTVASALNGRGRISEKTRVRILQLAEKSGYHPNASARALKKKTVIDLGMIAADGQDMFVLDFIRYCNEHSLRNQIELTSSSEPHFPLLLSPGYAKGVLYIGNISKEIQTFIKQNPDYPIVTVNELSPYCVCSDFESGIREGIEQLIDGGCRKIALFYVRETIYHELESISNTMKGFQSGTYQGQTIEFLHYPGSIYDDSHVRHRKFIRLLDSPDRPDGFFFCGMFDFRYLWYEILKRGLRMPDDLQIMSTGFYKEAAHFYPEPPFVGTDLKRSFDLAVDLLLRRIKGKTTGPETIFIPALLRKRMTVKNSNNSLKGK